MDIEAIGFGFIDVTLLVTHALLACACIIDLVITQGTKSVKANLSLLGLFCVFTALTFRELCDALDINMVAYVGNNHVDLQYLIANLIYVLGFVILLGAVVWSLFSRIRQKKAKDKDR